MASNFIKTSKLERFYVIAGDDIFFRREFIKELIGNFLQGKLDDSSTETFDFSEKADAETAAALIESASTPPFFSAMKFIVAVEFTKLKKDDIEPLIKYLPNIPEFTVLVLTTTLDAKKALDLDIPSKNIINLSASASADIKTWVNDYLAGMKKKIDPEVLDYIIGESNDEPSLVKSEIDKMLLLTGDKQEIDMDDFTRTRGTDKGYTLPELVEAISRKDEEKAFRVFEKIYEDTAPEQMMGFIFYEIKKMYIIRYFASIGDVKSVFKYGVYVKDLSAAIALSKNYMKVPYADMVAILKDADRQIKISSRARAKAIITIMLERIFMKLEGVSNGK